MASSTAPQPTNPPAPKQRLKLRRPPLSLRRFGAWVVEISMVACSASIPYAVGEYVKSGPNGTAVPPNPMVAEVGEAIAQTLALQQSDRQEPISPLTNLFWSIAIVAPLAVGGWQLYLLGTTGQTSPKRWLGVRVIAFRGGVPGIGRALVREGFGRWGLPVGIAYGIWRYSGAFPELAILLGLSGLMLVVEVFSGLFDRYYRTFHDRLAGTYPISEPLPIPYTNPQDEPPGALAVTPQTGASGRSLWGWMQEHPGITIVSAVGLGLGSVLTAFVGTQVFIQSQTTEVQLDAQDDQLFLELVEKLDPAAAEADQKRREVVLAIATLNDPRAYQFLVDLLVHESDPKLVDSIQQALFSVGPDALPYLHRANLALGKDMETLGPGSTSTQKNILRLKLRATQQAIVKILTIDRNPNSSYSLHRADLAKSAPPVAFVAVMDKTDLSGINFRGASLSQASLKWTRFYGAGDDQRLGTFDDRIADLSGTDLKEADLTGAILSNVPIRRTNLIRATLNKANLNQAKLTGSNLSSALLVNATLQSALLETASLTGADLSDSNFSYANLQEARLGQVQGINALFKFANLNQTTWKNANLSQADFNNAKLEAADFSDGKLIGTNFSNANLANANFTNANLILADLRGATLEGANFAGAVFQPQAKPTQKGDFVTEESATGDSNGLAGVDFSQTQNLDKNQLIYLCSQGAIHPNCSQLPEPDNK
ncbi:pentapeptide repeat-containing protein [Roseofilum casamattae]|uniref:Pentapeptide repeat-containing protein n=1 Tax=Roseofilum casamattae BLCC-M143 TaxID=3022442 RepID=A0ABT7BW10_9CYAN|nr:pentapeptide repeat-containing protein [Roseofilum casamattae]MDJ1183370.1 pentapeptide repeat-containing protein [Roseofilum casamattae BLCC-M143]